MIAAIAFGLSGCTDADPEAECADAGIDHRILRAVADTDDFTTEQTGSSELGDDGYRCVVSIDDEPRFEVTADLVADASEPSLSERDDAFEYAGGVGVLDAERGRWFCGQTVVTAGSVEVDSERLISLPRGLMSAVLVSAADEIGCTTPER